MRGRAGNKIGIMTGGPDPGVWTPDWLELFLDEFMRDIFRRPGGVDIYRGV